MEMLLCDQPINSEQLLNAFKLLGQNGHGELDYEQFITLLLTKGEKMREKEILAILNDEECCRDGKLEVIDLCVSILSTAALWDKITSKNINQENYNGRAINSRTFTRKKGTGHLMCSSDGSSGNDLLNCDLDTQNWNSQQLRGCFFTPSSGVILSHHYILELSENSSVWIGISSASISGNVTYNPITEILVFLENEGSSKIPVAVSVCSNIKGQCTVNADLKKGKYLLIPVVLNFPQSLQSNQEEEISIMYPLTSIDDNEKIVLSSVCYNALMSVFNCIDLDQNGLISKQEFELFIQHTSNETAAEEWPTVEENFQMQNGQLTFDGFLTLYQMAVETDPQDVSAMFQKMGFDNFLCMKQAFPFLLSVRSEVIQPILLPLSIAPSNHLAEKSFCKTALEQGYYTKICNMNDLALFIHKLPHRAVIVVQNQSHSTVRVRLDCSNSKNCSTHRQNMDYTVQVPHRTCVIGHHLFPIIMQHPWTVVCEETLVK